MNPSDKELTSIKNLVRLLKVREGLYIVKFTDTSVSLGQFSYRERSNLYMYEPPDYWDSYYEWEEDTLIAIGLHLRDLNLECGARKQETRQYD